MGPISVTKDHGLDIGPHPHVGLQTVTWLVRGEAVHHDSLGTEQLIKPGALNLMTAGSGVAHAEEATGQYEGQIHGVQLWIAQPEATRHLAPDFEHHAALPQLSLSNLDVTVLVGEFAGVASAARHDTELVGLELVVHGPSVVPLRLDFEHALIVLEGSLHVDDVVLEPGNLGYLGTGTDEVFLGATHPTRVMLLGGVPFESEILMWWNFVARSREEIDRAYDDWRDHGERFATVPSSLARIDSPAPYWRSPA